MTRQNIEGDLVTLRSESVEDDNRCAWEETVGLEGIGSVSQKLASVPKGNVEPPVSEDCPEAERLHKPKPEAGGDETRPNR